MNNKLLIPNQYAYSVCINWLVSTRYHVISKTRSGAVYRAFCEGGYAEYMTYKDFMLDKMISKQVKKLHAAKLEDLFSFDDTLNYCRKYRKMPFLQLGMRVDFSEGTGFIIKGGGSLTVYSLENSKCYIIHPTWKTTHYKDDVIVADYCNLM